MPRSVNTQRMSAPPPRHVAVLADPKQEAGMMMREILRSLSIHNPIISDDLSEIIRRAEGFAIDMLIIDDVPDNPAPLVLRELINHPICSILPIIALSSDLSKSDHDFLATLGRPMIVSKPLSPGRLANGFKALLKVWGSGYFLDIASAIESFKNNDRDKGMQTLITLSANPKSQAIVAPCLAGLLRRDDNLKVAEKVLLSSLKVARRDAGVMLSLCDLYLRSCMPHTAQRLLKSLEANYGTPLATVLDRLQAHLMLNEIDPAIEIAKKMVAANIRKDEFSHMLMKMLYTEGRVHELSASIDIKSGIHSMISAWNPPVTTTPRQAG